MHKNLDEGDTATAAASPGRSPTLSIGSVLGNYRIEAVLGRGGQAIVYLAHDLALGRLAAVKLFSDQLDVVSSLLDEARNIARVPHPNIVQVFHLQVGGTLPYLAMEYVRGGDLAAAVRRQGVFSVDRALASAKQVADALATAHDRGFLHRDVKPHNILGAANAQLKLADFGLAAPVLGLVTSVSRRIVGTPQYMAPEVWLGQDPSPAADVYGLGAVLYFMLVGRAPYNGDSPKDLKALHLAGDLHIPSTIPEAVSDLIRQLMHRDPRLRVQDARQAGALLESHSKELRRPRGAGAEARREQLVADDVARLGPFADVAVEVERRLRAGSPMVIAHGNAVKTVDRALDLQLEASGSSVLRIDLSEGDTLEHAAWSALATHGGDDRSDSLDVIAAKLADTAMGDATAAIVRLRSERALSRGEFRFLVDLARACATHSIAIVVCIPPLSGDELHELYGAQHLAPQLDVVPLRRPTSEEVAAHIVLWRRMFDRLSAYRWTAQALAALEDFTRSAPDRLPTVMSNATVVAAHLKTGFMTSWVIKAAVAHRNRLASSGDILPQWRTPPSRWP